MTNKPNKSSHDVIVEIKNLSRQFGEKKALNQINLQIPRGKVFGIVGENGAGKTTLIKHILGSLAAQKGQVNVFGHDPVANPEKALAHIGYLSEEPELPEWMTIAQYLNYMSAFYPRWDQEYANDLVESFGLDISEKIKNLSKGQRARTGLIAAQAHKPDLLLLDEPSSGLDPIIRKDILQAVIRTVVDEGRSVVFSSHFLDEVERVCDHLVMFSQGQVLVSAPMDEVLNHHYESVVRGPEDLIWLEDNRKQQEDSKQLTDNQSSNDGIFKAEYKYGEWIINSFGDKQCLQLSIQKKGCELLSTRQMSLNEIFVARSPNNKALQDRGTVDLKEAIA
jgi:ABC-2 type transport system ATP-binding protein